MLLFINIIFWLVTFVESGVVFDNTASLGRFRFDKTDVVGPLSIAPWGSSNVLLMPTMSDITIQQAVVILSFTGTQSWWTGTAFIELRLVANSATLIPSTMSLNSITGIAVPTVSVQVNLTRSRPTAVTFNISNIWGTLVNRRNYAFLIGSSDTTSKVVIHYADPVMSQQVISSANYLVWAAQSLQTGVNTFTTTSPAAFDLANAYAMQLFGVSMPLPKVSVDTSRTLLSPLSGTSLAYPLSLSFIAENASFVDTFSVRMTSTVAGTFTFSAALFSGTSSGAPQTAFQGALTLSASLTVSALGVGTALYVNFTVPTIGSHGSWPLLTPGRTYAIVVTETTTPNIGTRSIVRANQPVSQTTIGIPSSVCTLLPMTMRANDGSWPTPSATLFGYPSMMLSNDGSYTSLLDTANGLSSTSVAGQGVLFPSTANRGGAAIIISIPHRGSVVELAQIHIAVTCTGTPGRWASVDASLWKATPNTALPSTKAIISPAKTLVYCDSSINGGIAYAVIDTHDSSWPILSGGHWYGLSLSTNDTSGGLAWSYAFDDENNVATNTVVVYHSFLTRSSDANAWASPVSGNVLMPAVLLTGLQSSFTRAHTVADTAFSGLSRANTSISGINGFASLRIAPPRTGSALVLINRGTCELTIENVTLWLMSNATSSIATLSLALWAVNTSGFPIDAFPNAQPMVSTVYLAPTPLNSALPTSATSVSVPVTFSPRFGQELPPIGPGQSFALVLSMRSSSPPATLWLDTSLTTVSQSAAYMADSDGGIQLLYTVQQPNLAITGSKGWLPPALAQLSNVPAFYIRATPACRVILDTTQRGGRIGSKNQVHFLSDGSTAPWHAFTVLDTDPVNGVLLDTISFWLSGRSVNQIRWITLSVVTVHALGYPNANAFLDNIKYPKLFAAVDFSTAASGSVVDDILQRVTFRPLEEGWPALPSGRRIAFQINSDAAASQFVVLRQGDIAFSRLQANRTDSPLRLVGSHSLYGVWYTVEGQWAMSITLADIIEPPVLSLTSTSSTQSWNASTLPLGGRDKRTTAFSFMVGPSTFLSNGKSVPFALQPSNITFFLSSTLPGLWPVTVTLWTADIETGQPLNPISTVPSVQGFVRVVNASRSITNLPLTFSLLSWPALVGGSAYSIVLNSSTTESSAIALQCARVSSTSFTGSPVEWLRTWNSSSDSAWTPLLNSTYGSSVVFGNKAEADILLADTLHGAQMVVDTNGISIPLQSSTGNHLGISFSIPIDILSVATSVVTIPVTSFGSTPAWYGLTLTLLYSGLISGSIRPIIAVNGVQHINNTFSYRGVPGLVSMVSFNLAGIWPTLDGGQSYALGLACNVSGAVTWLYSLDSANNMPSASNIGVVQINGLSTRTTSSSLWANGTDGSKVPAMRLTGHVDVSLPEDAVWPILFDNTIQFSTWDTSSQFSDLPEIGPLVSGRAAAAVFTVTSSEPIILYNFTIMLRLNTTVTLVQPDNNVLLTARLYSADTGVPEALLPAAFPRQNNQRGVSSAISSEGSSFVGPAMVDEAGGAHPLLFVPQSPNGHFYLQPGRTYAIVVEAPVGRHIIVKWAQADPVVASGNPFNDAIHINGWSKQVVNNPQMNWTVPVGRPTLQFRGTTARIVLDNTNFGTLFGGCENLGVLGGSALNSNPAAYYIHKDHGAFLVFDTDPLLPLALESFSIPVSCENVAECSGQLRLVSMAADNIAPLWGSTVPGFSIVTAYDSWLDFDRFSPQFTWQRQSYRMMTFRVNDWPMLPPRRRFAFNVRGAPDGNTALAWYCGGTGASYATNGKVGGGLSPVSSWTYYGTVYREWRGTEMLGALITAKPFSMDAADWTNGTVRQSAFSPLHSAASLFFSNSTYGVQISSISVLLNATRAGSYLVRFSLWFANSLSGVPVSPIPGIMSETAIILVPPSRVGRTFLSDSISWSALLMPSQAYAVVCTFVSGPIGGLSIAFSTRESNSTTLATQDSAGRLLPIGAALQSAQGSSWIGLNSTLAVKIVSSKPLSVIVDTTSGLADLGSSSPANGLLIPGSNTGSSLAIVVSMEWETSQTALRSLVIPVSVTLKTLTEPVWIEFTLELLPASGGSSTAFRAKPLSHNLTCITPTVKMVSRFSNNFNSSVVSEQLVYFDVTYASWPVLISSHTRYSFALTVNDTSVGATWMASSSSTEVVHRGMNLHGMARREGRFQEWTPVNGNALGGIIVLAEFNSTSDNVLGDNTALGFVAWHGRHNVKSDNSTGLLLGSLSDGSAVSIQVLVTGASKIAVNRIRVWISSDFIAFYNPAAWLTWSRSLTFKGWLYSHITGGNTSDPGIPGVAFSLASPLQATPGTWRADAAIRNEVMPFDLTFQLGHGNNGWILSPGGTYVIVVEASGPVGYAGNIRWKLSDPTVQSTGPIYVIGSATQNSEMWTSTTPSPSSLNDFQQGGGRVVPSVTFFGNELEPTEVVADTTAGLTRWFETDVDGGGGVNFFSMFSTPQAEVDLHTVTILLKSTIWTPICLLSLTAVTQSVLTTYFDIIRSDHVDISLYRDIEGSFNFDASAGNYNKPRPMTFDVSSWPTLPESSSFAFKVDCTASATANQVSILLADRAFTSRGLLTMFNTTTGPSAVVSYTDQPFAAIITASSVRRAWLSETTINTTLPNTITLGTGLIAIGFITDPVFSMIPSNFTTQVFSTKAVGLVQLTATLWSVDSATGFPVTPLALAPSVQYSFFVNSARVNRTFPITIPIHTWPILRSSRSYAIVLSSNELTGSISLLPVSLNVSNTIIPKTSFSPYSVSSRSSSSSSPWIVFSGSGSTWFAFSVLVGGLPLQSELDSAEDNNGTGITASSLGVSFPYPNVEFGEAGLGAGTSQGSLAIVFAQNDVTLTATIDRLVLVLSSPSAVNGPVWFNLTFTLWVTSPPVDLPLRPASTDLAQQFSQIVCHPGVGTRPGQLSSTMFAASINLETIWPSLTIGTYAIAVSSNSSDLLWLSSDDNNTVPEINTGPFVLRHLAVKEDAFSSWTLVTNHSFPSVQIFGRKQASVLTSGVSRVRYKPSFVLLDTTFSNLLVKEGPTGIDNRVTLGPMSSGLAVAIIIKSNSGAPINVDAITLLVSTNATGSITFTVSLYGVGKRSLAPTYSLSAACVVSSPVLFTGSVLDRVTPIVITKSSGCWPLISRLRSYALVVESSDTNEKVSLRLADSDLMQAFVSRMLEGNQVIGSIVSVGTMVQTGLSGSWGLLNPTLTAAISLMGTFETVVADNTVLQTNTPDWSAGIPHLVWWNIGWDPTTSTLQGICQTYRSDPDITFELDKINLYIAHLLSGLTYVYVNIYTANPITGEANRNTPFPFSSGHAADFLFTINEPGTGSALRPLVLQMPPYVSWTFPPNSVFAIEIRGFASNPNNLNIRVILPDWNQGIVDNMNYKVRPFGNVKRNLAGTLYDPPAGSEWMAPYMLHARGESTMTLASPGALARNTTRGSTDTWSPGCTSFIATSPLALAFSTSLNTSLSLSSFTLTMNASIIGSYTFSAELWMTFSETGIPSSRIESSRLVFASINIDKNNVGKLTNITFSVGLKNSVQITNSMASPLSNIWPQLLPAVRYAVVVKLVSGSSGGVGWAWSKSSTSSNIITTGFFSQNVNNIWSIASLQPQSFGAAYMTGQRSILTYYDNTAGGAVVAGPGPFIRSRIVGGAIAIPFVTASFGLSNIRTVTLVVQGSIAAAYSLTLELFAVDAQKGYIPTVRLGDFSSSTIFEVPTDRTNTPLLLSFDLRGNVPGSLAGGAYAFVISTNDTSWDLRIMRALDDGSNIDGSGGGLRGLGLFNSSRFGGISWPSLSNGIFVPSMSTESKKLKWETVLPGMYETEEERWVIRAVNEELPNPLPSSFFFR
jgi:hypothetical protein